MTHRFPSISLSTFFYIQIILFQKMILTNQNKTILIKYIEEERKIGQFELRIISPWHRTVFFSARWWSVVHEEGADVSHFFLNVHSPLSFDWLTDGVRVTEPPRIYKNHGSSRDRLLVRIDHAQLLILSSILFHTQSQTHLHKNKHTYKYIKSFPETSSNSLSMQFSFSDLTFRKIVFFKQ